MRRLMLLPQFSQEEVDVYQKHRSDRILIEGSDFSELIKDDDGYDNNLTLADIKSKGWNYFTIYNNSNNMYIVLSTQPQLAYYYVWANSVVSLPKMVVIRWAVGQYGNQKLSLDMIPDANSENLSTSRTKKIDDGFILADFQAFLKYSNEDLYWSRGLC